MGNKESSLFVEGGGGGGSLLLLFFLWNLHLESMLVNVNICLCVMCVVCAYV